MTLYLVHMWSSVVISFSGHPFHACSYMYLNHVLLLLLLLLLWLLLLWLLLLWLLLLWLLFLFKGGGSGVC